MKNKCQEKFPPLPEKFTDMIIAFLSPGIHHSGKAQAWIAISIYVLAAIIKKRLKLKPNLYTILQIFSVAIFEKTPIFQVLTKTEVVEQNSENDNQLMLFKLR